MLQQQFMGKLISLPKANSGTKPIQGHTFIPITHSTLDHSFHTFYLCGGRTHSTEKNTRNILSDIVKFNIKRRDEQDLFEIENIPIGEGGIDVKLDSPRHNHTSLYFESIDSVVTFGGSNTEHYFNSVFVMNIQDERKQEILLEGGKEGWPKTRHAHSANVYKQDQMIVFGGKKGYGLETDLFLNDLWSFNVKKKEWNELKSLNAAPRARCWHSSAIFQDKYLLVSGGFYTLNGDECYLNDLWSFDLEKRKWKCLIEDNGGKSRKMQQRNRFGMVLSENSLFVMFGNYFDGYRDHFLTDIFYIQDVNSLLLKETKQVWTPLKFQAQDEEAKKFLNEGRGHVSSVLLSETKESIEILLFGGESYMKRHDNFLLLKIEKKL